MLPDGSVRRIPFEVRRAPLLAQLAHFSLLEADYACARTLCRVPQVMVRGDKVPVYEETLQDNGR